MVNTVHRGGDDDDGDDGGGDDDDDDDDDDNNNNNNNNNKGICSKLIDPKFHFYVLRFFLNQGVVNCVVLCTVCV